MQQIGPYTLLDEIARGGHGVVYRAQDAQGQVVALKLLLAHRAANERAKRRLEGEVRALARLAHPNVVALLGSGEQQGSPWIALEFVEGETLETRLSGGPLQIDEAIGVARQIGRALVYVHAQALLHRDLKPDNVLLRGDQVLLTDFGLALEMEASRTRLTQTGMFIGTPGYWAPEQARGETEAFRPTTDIYGLGAVLYACLTGHPPVQADSLQEYLQTFQFHGVTAPNTVRPEVPEWLSDLCMRCLSVAPTARPQSAEAFLRGLEPPRTEAEPSSAPEEAPTAPTASAPVSPGPMQSRRPLLIGLGSAIPALLVGALFLYPDATQEPAPQASSLDEVAPTLLVLSPKADQQVSTGPVTVRGISRDLGGAVRVEIGELSTRVDSKGAFALTVELAELPATLTVTATDEAGNTTTKTLPLSGATRPRAKPSDMELQLEAQALAESGGRKSDEGSFAEAIADLDAAIQLDPRNATAYRNRAITEGRLGRYAEAIADFDNALDLNPQDARAYASRGFNKARLDRDTGAIEDFDKAIQLDPRDAFAYRNRGASKSKLGRHAEAIEDYDKAIQLDPRDTYAYRNRGATKAWLGSFAEALEDYDKAIELGMPQAEANRVKQWRTEVAAKLAEQPTTPTDTQREQAKALCKGGNAHLRGGRYVEAIEDYDTAIQLDPQFAEAYRNRGGCKAELGRNAEAIEDFDTAIELDPQFAFAYSNRGLSKADLGRNAEAIEDFDTAIELDPQFAFAYSNRGLSKAGLGRYAEAIEDYDRALEISLLQAHADQVKQWRAEAAARLAAERD